MNSGLESPHLDEFRKYAAELTEKHDKHERLVRISRDVTIESKRIIFYLHSLKSNDDSSKLDEAEKRIAALADGPLKKAAAELKTGFSTSISVPRHVAPGLEELVEAYCLLQYMRHPEGLKLPSWADMQRVLREKLVDSEPHLHVNPLDFMLGMMDFTGELMRLCINNASSEDSSLCFDVCRLMQEIYAGFLRICYNKDLNKKMSTLKQSLQKVEDTCYKLKIRNLQL